MPGPELTKDQRKFIFGEYLPKLKSTYCGDQAEWRLVRAINYNLLWLGLDNNRQVTFADRTTPEDCDPKHQ